MCIWLAVYTPACYDGAILIIKHCDPALYTSSAVFSISTSGIVRYAKHTAVCTQSLNSVYGACCVLCVMQQQARQLTIDIARAQHEMDVLTQRYGTHSRATELQVR
jgi:formate hydrogenlyase subunit 4